MAEWEGFTDGLTSMERGRRKRSLRLAAAREKGTHTKQEWKILHDIFDGCVCCGVPYSDLHGGEATKDHIQMIMAGGCDCIANLQPVCRQCNSGSIITGDMRESALPGWQTVYLHRLGAYY